MRVFYGGPTMQLEGVMGLKMLSAVCAATAAVSVVYAGGWGTVTVEDVPHYGTAGREITLPYTIRGHGQSLSRYLATVVEARAAAELVTGTAGEGVDKLHHVARITIPRPGTWV